jgi:hypothetical protein
MGVRDSGNRTIDFEEFGFCLSFKCNFFRRTGEELSGRERRYSSMLRSEKIASGVF